jgi:riboflavin kinase / FMN adenylyltransferase
MIVVQGVRGLRPEHGRLFVVLGVFDGLHLGHLYLLEQLRAAAEARGAVPAVVTFDHHPDEILTGSAPALLCDPAERLERLAAAGVGLTVVHHFDVETRMTPYDAFVRSIAERVDLAGFLMTPESAFGYERGGSPAAVAALGEVLGYDVVVVPTLEVDGRPVRSAEIRAAIARGDLGAAAELLGRPYAVVGDPGAGGDLAFPVPVALPPAGAYAATVDGRAATATIAVDGRLTLGAGLAAGPRTRVVFG